MQTTPTTEDTPMNPNPTTDTNSEDGSYGELAPEVLTAVSQLRTRSEALVAEIGRMEVHKTALSHEAVEVNQKAQNLLQQEAQRLGIPNGTSWRLTPEGVAMAVEEG